MRCFLLAVGVLALSLSSSAQALSNLTGHYSDGSGLTAEELKSDQEWGQSFQIASSGGLLEASVESVVLWLYRQNNQNGKTITASIRSTWNGASVWEATLPANDVEKDSDADQSAIHDSVTFSAAAATLQTDTWYYLRVDTTSSEKVYIHYDQESSYSPGNLINKDGDSAGSGKDLLFSIQGNYVVPEPSTGLLVALGLAGFAQQRRARRSNFVKPTSRNRNA